MRHMLIQPPPHEGDFAAYNYAPPDARPARVAEKLPRLRGLARPVAKWNTRDLVQYFEESWFQKTRGRTDMGWRPISNRAALGSHLARWRRQGLPSEEIAGMMDMFSPHDVKPGKAPWQVFVYHHEIWRQRLQERQRGERWRRMAAESRQNRVLVGTGGVGLREATGDSSEAHPSNPRWTPHV